MSIDTKEANNMELPESLEGMDAKKLWERIYGKELNTKKAILEYIELVKVLKEDKVPKELIQDTYNLIYNSIEDMSSIIKVNTKLHLRNQLKAQLAKYVEDKDPKPVNHFIEFFKEAYPEGTRRKDFTWVLEDIKKITEEQIWTTIAYINAWQLKGNVLSEPQKKDTIKMIELLVSKGNIKYINQLRSLEKFLKGLNIKIIAIKDRFKVKSR
jgi:hypothetical protein